MLCFREKIYEKYLFLVLNYQLLPIKKSKYLYMSYELYMTEFHILKYDKYTYHNNSNLFLIIKIFLFIEQKIIHLSYSIGSFLFLYR